MCNNGKLLMIAPIFDGYILGTIFHFKSLKRHCRFSGLCEACLFCGVCVGGGRLLQSHSWIQLCGVCFCSDVYGCCLVWSGIHSDGDISVLSKWFSQQQWFALWSQTLVPGERHVAVYLYYMYVQMYHLMGCYIYVIYVFITWSKIGFNFLYYKNGVILIYWPKFTGPGKDF